MQNHYKVCALIWTYNPDIRLLEKVIKAALENVDHMLIVDNGSRNRELIEKLKSENVEIVHLPRNLGVEALNIGFNILTKKETCEWILILDDDSIIEQPGSIREVLDKFCLLPEELKHKIAVISISDLESVSLTLKRKLNILPRESLVAHFDTVIFSGALIKTEILIKHKLYIDKELFLDHADTDFFTRIRKLGYLTIIYTKPLLRHRRGLPLSRPINLGFYIINTTTRPHRLYYIVRNATYLLLRKRITFLQWILSILRFTIPLMLQSPKSTLKAVLIGLAHGIAGGKKRSA
ncbi:MAG: glycosyltransferase [Acidilobaceae archaeon]